MAEEHNNPAVDPEQGQNGQASNPPEPEKTVSLAEMQRRLKQAEEKHAQATQEAIAQALKQYKAENELSGSFRAVLFRMVSKQNIYLKYNTTGFRAVLFRMVSKHILLA